MADNNGKDIFKSLILAGVGALTMTAEKISESIAELHKIGKITAEQGKEIIDELVKKGEITVEQGKGIIEKLKATKEQDEVVDLNSMDDEKLAHLKELIQKIEREREGE